MKCHSRLPNILLILFGMGLLQPAWAQPGLVDRDVGRAIDREVERDVSRQIGRQVDRQIENRIDRQIGGAVEQRIDQQVDQQIRRSLPSAGQNRLDLTDPNPMSPTAIGRVSRDAPSLPAAARDAQSRRQARAEEHETNTPAYPTSRYHDQMRDPAGFLYLRDQWLVLGDAARVEELELSGFNIKKITALDGLGQLLIEVDLAGGQAQTKSAGQDYEDFNHIYLYQSDSQTKQTDAPWLPVVALPLRQPETPVSIGLIDSQVNVRNEALRRSNIVARSFIEGNLPEPDEHGTAIASILAGTSSQIPGLLPAAKVFSASVFYKTEEAAHIASVKSILLAIDWMIQSQVTVINMSLSGPPNRLLQLAVEQAQAKSIVIVAAAGNDGPAAPSVYPAAYPRVVAVTAVNQQKNVYFRANRGSYIDFAAPGVNIVHAAQNDGKSHSSGTSYAAPFVTAAFASLLTQYSAEEAYLLLTRYALDLGEPEFDELYGWGLIQLP